MGFEHPTPRTILMDLEPGRTDPARAVPFEQLFRPDASPAFGRSHLRKSNAYSYSMKIKSDRWHILYEGRKSSPAQNFWNGASMI